jgi:hypothetical protein
MELPSSFLLNPDSSDVDTDSFGPLDDQEIWFCIVLI